MGKSYLFFDRDFPGTRINRDYLGVYIIRYKSRVFGYKEDFSPVIYIGEGKISDRIFAHANGKGHGNSFVFAELNNGADLRVSWALTDNKDHAVQAENELLGVFIERYGQLPLGNSKGCTSNVASYTLSWGWSGKTFRPLATKELLSELTGRSGGQRRKAKTKPRKRQAELAYANSQLVDYFIKVRPYNSGKKHPPWMVGYFRESGKELLKLEKEGDLAAALERAYRVAKRMNRDDLERALNRVVNNWSL